MLVALLVVVTAFLAPDLRIYLEQRAQIASLRADVASTTVQVNELQRQKDQWADPAYVAAQARQRLRYVFPGETGYVVLAPPSGPAPAVDPARQAARSAAKPGQPWFSDVWASVQLAGTDPLPASGPPATGARP